MPAPSLTAPHLAVTPWDDPVIDALGHHPCSAYVERFWLPIVGPSTTWLVRHLSQCLDVEPDGFDLEVRAVAGSLGLGTTEGRHSPIVRALHRACQFGLARARSDAALMVRRSLPPLTRHQLERLPLGVQAEHAAWQALDHDSGSLAAQTRRARRIALALVELGEDVPGTAERLHRWQVHPAVAHDAARWAQRVLASAAEPVGAGRDEAA